MKNLFVFLNDMNDTRHLNRLFKKYDKPKYNFAAIYEYILDRINYCNTPDKLQEYYDDMRYLKSVEAAWQKKSQERDNLCKKMREQIACL